MLPKTDKVFPHSYSFENGSMHPGEAQAWAWISMNRWLRRIRTSVPTYP